jgi:hypothetical protein
MSSLFPPGRVTKGMTTFKMAGKILKGCYKDVIPFYERNCSFRYGMNNSKAWPAYFFMDRICFTIASASSFDIVG